MQHDKHYHQQKYIGPQQMNDDDTFESPMIPMSLVQNISDCIVCINTSSWTGTGFLCHLPIENSVSLFYGLMTNNHVLPESELVEGNIINLSSDNQIFEHGKSEAEIEIGPNRYIFTSEELDATFISISPSELGTSFNWLEVSKDECQKGQSIFIIQHPNGGPQKLAYGTIQVIDGIDIHHLVSTKPGSSGSPVIEPKGTVIGLNKAESVKFAYNIATKSSEIVDAIQNDRIEKYSDSIPPEVASAIENSKKALYDLQRQRKSFESMQINVFYAKKWQINDGAPESRRITMEKERDQQENVFKKSEQKYKSSISTLENLVNRCKDLKRFDLYKLLLSEEADLLVNEATNRKERVSFLDNEIPKAKKPKFFGGMDSCYRSRLEEMQRNARNEAYNLEQRAANIRALLMSYQE